MAAPTNYQQCNNMASSIIRDCNEYYRSWKDCNSWRNKFHEYYVHGRQSSCDQWKEDYDNCLLWKAKQFVPAKGALIESERMRLRSVQDDSPPVWELRSKPCPDWPKHPSSGKVSQEEPS